MPTERVEALNARGRTRALTDCAAQEVEPACALASAAVLDCWYAPEVTDQLPPEVLQPDALPSSKLSEKRVAALAGPESAATTTTTVPAATAASASRPRWTPNARVLPGRGVNQRFRK